MKQITLIGTSCLILIFMTAGFRACHAAQFVIVGNYFEGDDPGEKEFKLLIAELEKNRVNVEVAGSTLGDVIRAPSSDAEKARKIINEVVLKHNLKTIWATDEKGNRMPIKKE